MTSPRWTTTICVAGADQSCEFGEATAILAGDGLLTRAFEIIARDIQPAEVAAACCVELLATAAGAEGMVGRATADLEAETNSGAHGRGARSDSSPQNGVYFRQHC